LKQKVYVMIAFINIIIYFYLLFFLPKLESYSYEQYKSMMESTGNVSEEEIEQLTNKENTVDLHIDNITEFSNKYKGEIPLAQITTVLRKNINENFKFIAEEYNQKDVTKIFNDNKEILYRFMGINQSDDLKEILNKLESLKDENISITKAEVTKDSCKRLEDYTEFNLMLYLSDETTIELNIKVNNFLKNQRSILVVE